MKRMQRAYFKPRSLGFTLLEVLVSIAIFTVVGALALSGYNQLLRQSDRAREVMARVRAVQIAVARISQDLEQLEPRPTRQPLGQGVEPALLADPRTNTALQLTRSGWTNPAGIQRSTLQRVAYRFADGKLYRDYWTVLDRTLTNEPVEVEMLDKVRSVKIRFLQSNGQWIDQWPVVSSGTGPVLIGTPRNRPVAIEITLDLEDWGAIKRLVEVAG